MKRDIVLKQIDCLRDTKSHLWTAVIVSAGGTLTLLPNLKNPLNITMFILGLFSTIIFLNSYMQKDLTIDRLLEKLEEANNANK